MPPKKSYCQMCKKVSRSFDLSLLSDLSMKTSNGENLTLLKAIQQLTGIDVNIFSFVYKKQRKKKKPPNTLFKSTANII